MYFAVWHTTSLLSILGPLNVLNLVVRQSVLRSHLILSVSPRGSMFFGKLIHCHFVNNLRQLFIEKAIKSYCGLYLINVTDI